MIRVDAIQRIKAVMKGDTSPITPRPKMMLLEKNTGTARKINQSVERVAVGLADDDIGFTGMFDATFHTKENRSVSGGCCGSTKKDGGSG